MTQGRLYDVARRQRALLLSNERQAATEMVNVYGDIWVRIKSRLDALLAEREELLLAGETVDTSWLFQYDRLGKLLQQVQDELRRFAIYADRSIDRQQSQAVEAAARDAREQIQTIAARAWVSLDWAYLPTGAIEDLVGFLANGSPLRDLLDKLGPLASKRIRESLIEGIAQGYNPEKIGRSVREAFGGNLSRALRVSRTEVLRSYREATRRSYEANDDVVEGWIWNAACTTRTCAMCVTGDTLVSGPLPQEVFARHYTGNIVVIETASGKHLSITPNHPILTRRGWVKAGLLKEGDDVISSADGDGTTLGIGIDNYQMPTLIREVAKSFSMISAEMECTSPDFHGDGIGSEVYIVRTNGPLRGEASLFTEQQITEHDFALRGAGIQPLGGFIFPQTSGPTTLLPRLLIRLGMILEGMFPFLQRDSTTAQDATFFGGTTGGVGYPQTNRDSVSIDTEGLSQRFLGLSGLVTSGDFSIGKLQRAMSQSTVFAASNGVPFFLSAEQSALLQDGSETFPTDTELGCNLLGSLTGKVSLDRVLKIDIRSFSGHVYNLQTESGWYFSNGIITHNCWAMHGTIHPVTELFATHPNCRCSMIPLTKNIEGMPPQWRPEPGVDQFAKLSEEEQQHILGPLYDAYHSGEINLSDVVGRSFSRDWGSMRRVRSLKEILGV